MFMVQANLVFFLLEVRFKLKSLKTRWQSLILSIIEKVFHYIHLKHYFFKHYFLSTWQTWMGFDKSMKWKDLNKYIIIQIT